VTRPADRGVITSRPADLLYSIQSARPSREPTRERPRRQRHPGIRTHDEDPTGPTVGARIALVDAAMTAANDDAAEDPAEKAAQAAPATMLADAAVAGAAC